jgi:predicted tellurium resistance membrane protein TerC
MLEVLTDYQIWVSLLTLTALEIVLGIDNLIFRGSFRNILIKPSNS